VSTVRRRRATASRVAALEAAILDTTAALDAALDHLAGSSEFTGGALTAWMEEARDKALALMTAPEPDCG
jgi:hypothetical protein